MHQPLRVILYGMNILLLLLLKYFDKLFMDIIEMKLYCYDDNI